MKKKLTPQKLARVDAWYAAWNTPRKRMAAELGVCERTLMNAARRRNGYEHRG
jgi:hypothetical protein